MYGYTAGPISPSESALGQRGPERGFTLIEVVMVIAIVGLLLGAILTPLATQYAMRKNNETEQGLKDIRDALIGFAMANGRLPCPDDSADGVDGVEDRTDNAAGTRDTCSDYEAYFPWVTLGLPPTDSWGRIYHYGVSQNFIQVTSPGSACVVSTDDILGLCDVAALRVFDRGDDPASGSGGEGKEQVDLTTTAPAVVWSAGSNGSGGLDFAGNSIPNPASNTDELENLVSFAFGNTPFTYVARGRTPGGTGCNDAVESSVFCEYDDVMIWLSAPLLFSRLVEANQLP